MPRCDETVRREYLMCSFHWARVSRSVQREVYRTFRAWWDEGDTKAAYDAAVEKAIAEAQA